MTTLAASSFGRLDFLKPFFLAAGVGDLNSETADLKVDSVQFAVIVDYFDAVVAA